MSSVALQREPAWETFHRRWAGLAAPLRPHEEVCSAVRDLIALHRSRVLLLGVTPEFADLGCATTAVDWSEGGVAHIWPGNTARRRAIRGDWQHLPLAPAAASAAIGDGSLNCLTYPGGYERVFLELKCAVREGGRIVIRTYLTPAACEPVAAIREQALAGAIVSLHAFKWRLAMALCAERAQPNLEVQAILHAFNGLFPDRRLLTRATGWSDEVVGHLDAYAQSSEVFSFPTAERLLTCVPPGLTPRLLAAGTYELAERCPLLVIDVKR